MTFPMRIEPIQSVDTAEVLKITYRTGLFGKDMARSGLVDDLRLFGYYYCWYYLRYEPEHCVCARAGDTILGYIVGTPDTCRQRARFIETRIPKILKRSIYTNHMGRIEQDHPGWMRWSLHEVIGGLTTAPPDYIERYPAHLHINVLPEYHGKGIGRALMEHLLDHMRSCGVPGIHLQTSSANHKALAFYERMGFELLGSEPIDHPPVGFEGVQGLAFGLRL